MYNEAANKLKMESCEMDTRELDAQRIIFV